NGTEKRPAFSRCLLPLRPSVLLGASRTEQAQEPPRPLGTYRDSLALLARTRPGPRMRGKRDAADLVQQTLRTAHQVPGQFRGTEQEQGRRGRPVVPRHEEMAFAAC